MSTDFNASFLLAAQQARARSEEPGTPLPVIDEQVSEDLIKWVESLTPEKIEELLKFASDATGVTFDPKDFAQLLPPVPEVCEAFSPLAPGAEPPAFSMGTPGSPNGWLESWPGTRECAPTWHERRKYEHDTRMLQLAAELGPEYPCIMCHEKRIAAHPQAYEEHRTMDECALMAEHEGDTALLGDELVRADWALVLLDFKYWQFSDDFIAGLQDWWRLEMMHGGATYGWFLEEMAKYRELEESAKALGALMVYPCEVGSPRWQLQREVAGRVAVQA